MFVHPNTTRHLFLGFFAVVILLASGCSATSASVQSLSGCQITASVASTTSVQITVTCSGGTAPYTISSITLGGVAATSVSGSTAGFTSSTVVVVSAASAVNGQVGSVSVYDSSSNANPQAYAFTVGSTSILSTSTGCTITPSTTTPYVNQTVQFTFSVSGSWGTAPYTFSSFNPGLNGLIVQSAIVGGSTQGTVTASYRVAGTPTATISVSDATGNIQTCNAQLNVGGAGGTTVGGTGTISCHITGSTNSDGTVSFQIIEDSNPSDPLNVTSFDPGLYGTVVNTGYPFIARYTAGGSKTANATAYSSTTNAQCSMVPFTFNLGSSGVTTGNTASSCPVPIQVSASSISHGSAVQIALGAYGGVSLLQIVYPTNAGVSGNFTSATSATLSFAYPSASVGYTNGFPLTAVISENGQQIACGLIEVVY